MKQYRILFFSILSALMLFSACTDDEDPKYEIGTYASSAQFTDPDSGKEYVLLEGTENNTFEVYGWSASDYGIPIGMRYTLELDLYDNNFEAPVTLLTTTDRQARITVSEMNNAISLLGVTNYEEATRFKMRVVTKAYGGEEGITLLPDYPTVYSETIEFLVTPYQSIAAYPTNLYMVGEEFGNWDWNSDGITEMIPVWGKEGSFWCVRYFNEGKGFKWAPKKAWGEDFPELDQVIGYSVSDGNAFVPASGLYMVYIDMAKGLIAIEEAKVYGIGDCFGSWDEGQYLFDITGNTASYTTTGTGELRMYAGSTYATSDWWTREFVIINGKIEYRATGDDQERVTVAAGKKVTLDFNAGTGSF
jgi:hypothetical protein